MSDPRATLANTRVAHVSLRGQVDAARFVTGERLRITTPVADVRKTPDSVALERQLLMGEPFLMLETTDGVAFGQAEHSGYVGYVDATALGLWHAPTHVVCVRTTLAFDAPDLKTPAPTPISLGSHLCITGRDGTFLRTAQNQYIPQDHLRPVDQPETDYVDVAARLLGTPYLWGGNSAFGIDCSGLVQIALAACGRTCPGDSDQQEQNLGDAQPPNTPLQRGDLLFWKGHVALVWAPDMLLHANGSHMAVAFEPLEPAIARIIAQGDGPVTSHRRP